MEKNISNIFLIGKVLNKNPNFLFPCGLIETFGYIMIKEKVLNINLEDLTLINGLMWFNAIKIKMRESFCVINCYNNERLFTKIDNK